MALSSAWWSWQAILNFSHISIKLKNQNKNLKWAAVSWHFRKQVGIIAGFYVLAPRSLSCKSKDKYRDKKKLGKTMLLISYISRVAISNKGFKTDVRPFFKTVT